MHDHNLDDLIIDNIEPKNSKAKSFLTIVALMIVVLIVAIILTKILLKTPNNSDLTFEQDETEMIAPELKLKEATKAPETEKESTISRIMESEPKAPASETKEPVKEEATVLKEEKSDSVLSNIAEAEMNAPAAEPLVAIEKEKDAADIAYWKSVQEKRKAEKAVEEGNIEEAAEETTKVTESIKPKKIPVQNTPKPITKPVVQKSKPKTISYGNYFVQVGAYKNSPGARFMSVIRNNNYEYTISEPDAKGIKRILIGPYKDSASASRALREIKDRVNKRAFIVKR